MQLVSRVKVDTSSLPAAAALREIASCPLDGGSFERWDLRDRLRDE
jgi:hypothetical protein